MAVRFTLCFNILFGFILHNALSFSPPILSFVGNEYTIKSGDNYTMECKGHEPIEWNYPRNESSDSINDTAVKIFNESTDKSGYTYGSILKINNASFENVGYYTCKGVNASDTDRSRATRMYLFVEDDERLFVLSNDPDIDNSIVTHSKSEANIPCRPTSPDISVTLSLSGAVVPLGMSTLDDNTNTVNLTYNPHVGFTIMFGMDVNFEPEIFMCNFTRNHIEFNAYFFISFQKIPTSISKPVITDMNEGHTVIGNNLTLKCNLSSSFADTKITWKLPNPTRDNVGLNDPQEEYIMINKMVITNVTLEDRGIYTCLVTDGYNNNNSSMNVRVFDVNEHFINLTVENDVFNNSVRVGDQSSVQWRIDIDAHPIDGLTPTWYDNNGDKIIGGSEKKGGKYETHFSPTEAFLKINFININDFGNYTLVVNNTYASERLQVFLHVIDKPTVHIVSESFHYIETDSELKCIAAGFPEPAITWSYRPCLDKSCDEKNLTVNSSERKGLQITSILKIPSNDSGYVTCKAINRLGSDVTTTAYYVTDVPNGFNIWVSDNVIEERDSNISKAVVGDKLDLSCAGSIYNNFTDINWYINGMPIETNDNHKIERSQTKYSNKTTLVIKNSIKNDSAHYLCRATTGMNVTQEKSINLELSEPFKPKINKSNMSDLIEIDIGDELNLTCYFHGIPRPSLIWSKDYVELTPNNRIKFLDNRSVLQIPKTDLSDEGTYECKAKNRMGTTMKSAEIVFRNKPSLMWLHTTILVLTVVVIICIIILVVKTRKEKKLRYELKKVGLENFEKGDVGSFNPDLGIDDQADLLPYDKKWEFPREKLKFGKQLGSGAFGVVTKAEAEGIVCGEHSTTVAVKMVKRNADNAYIKALASELKIMAHLGKHVNVVNLLGACTKNVAKRELYVIVEYCRFGNMQNYLFRHRANFINQIDEDTGKINFAIGSEVSNDRSVSFSSNRSNSNTSKSPSLKYVALKVLPNSGKQEGHVNKLMADYRGANYTGQSTQTDTTLVSTSPTGGTGEMILTSSNSSDQPEWRSNYRGDYKDNVKSICTKDLLTFSFQVARGMEYLASRKVLHGDLAARNILLAENNVVKICDFGLAKSMYNDGNYKKKGNGPLPVKWMAVESIRDRIFSTQSDVWSFGIVLWEFFSMSKSPYPGMDVDERLYHKLVDGYRMDCPTYASNEIYKMMLDCWEGKPTQRPSFTQLVQQIGLMLDKNIRQHYIDLNDPYLVKNMNRLEEGESDYLAMVAPPDFENLSSPQHYLNEPPGSNLNGYMCMKPANIFSPREIDGNIFTFDVNNKPTHYDSGVELQSMLHSKLNESLSDKGEMPITPTPSFSNTSYYILPNVTKASQEILQSSDNYVNKSQNKCAVSDSPEKYTPYSEKPYVNSQIRDWERLPV